MILIMDCSSKKVKHISKILNKLKIEFEVKELKKIGSFKDFSGIIISGAPILLTKTNKSRYSRILKIIKNSKTPILGICFGHQLIGLAHNSKITLGENIEKKEKTTQIKKDKLFKKIKQNTKFKEDHEEYTTLPKNFELLASSDSCKIEAMKHKTKQIYGVQFHPEVSGSNGKQLLKNFCKICKNYSVCGDSL